MRSGADIVKVLQFLGFEAAGRVVAYEGGFAVMDGLGDEDFSWRLSVS